MIWIALLVIVYVGLALFAKSKLTKILKKYRNVPDIPIEQAKSGIKRTDFNQWNETGLKRGCWIRFPFKFAGLLFIVFGIAILLFLTKPFKNIKYLRTIANKTTHMFSRIALVVISFIFTFDRQYQKDFQIQTAIVVSNHVCWFDFIYMMCNFWPIAEMAKATVSDIPIVGFVARQTQCIFVGRDTEKGTSQAVLDIANRVQKYKEWRNNKSLPIVNPLLIFPQATTSNGTSLLRFKAGAFTPLTQLTVLTFEYNSQQLSLGMDQISQSQHIILSMCASGSLKVRAWKMQPAQNQTVQDWMSRVRLQMSKRSNLSLCEAGYRDKVQFNNKIKESLANRAKSS